MQDFNLEGISAKTLQKQTRPKVKFPCHEPFERILFTNISQHQISASSAVLRDHWERVC